MRSRTPFVGFGVALTALSLATVLLWAPPAVAQQPNVSAALITLDDLPAGWRTFDPEEFDAPLAPPTRPGPTKMAPSRPTMTPPLEPDFELSPTCLMLLARLEGAEDAEPLAEAEAFFQRGVLGPFLFHSVSLLPPGAAAQTFAFFDAAILQAFFDTCFQDLLRGFAEEFGPEGSPDDLGLSVRVTPLSFAQVGDQSAALRLDFTLGFFGTSMLMALTRQGDALSALVLLADPNTATASASMIEDLARRGDARLAQILAGR